MKVEPLSIDIVGLVGACSYALDCIEAELVNVKNKHGKRVAYGSNRADFSFIPGGVVPGIRILKPDFPENREDYPFLWSENEYVIDLAASYIYLVNAVNNLLK